MKTIARAAPLSERERFANMGIRQLHGMIGSRHEHLRDNIRNGVFKNRPEMLDGLLHALETRKVELSAFRIEWAQRPREVFEANAAKRREEAGPNGEYDRDARLCRPSKHKTGGKGQMSAALARGSQAPRSTALTPRADA